MLPDLRLVRVHKAGSYLLKPLQDGRYRGFFYGRVRIPHKCVFGIADDYLITGTRMHLLLNCAYERRIDDIGYISRYRSFLPEAVRRRVHCF